MKKRKWLPLIFCCIFLLGEGNYFAQAGIEGSLPPPGRYDRAQDAQLRDSLQRAFGHLKTIPPEIELQALRALSHYPELRGIRIRFLRKPAKIAHASRPRMGSLFRRKSRRRYLIIVSTETPPHRAPGMQDSLSYNAQTGVLGHELGHTLDYSQRGFFGMIGWGIRYGFSKKFVRNRENETDRIAIRHNLGFQLLEWSETVHELLEKDGRGDNYLRPDEIRAAMGGSGNYRRQD